VPTSDATRLDERFDSGASGGTSRYWSANRAMSRKIGAATTPPQKFVVIDYVNDQIDTRIQSKAVDGVPDEVMRNVAAQLAKLAKNAA
jgi:hypothetical protein